MDQLITIPGQAFVTDMIALGHLPADTDAHAVMSAAHMGRRGQRYAVIPATAHGVLDCRSGRVVPLPAGTDATMEDARDWAAELNG